MNTPKKIVAENTMGSLSAVMIDDIKLVVADAEALLKETAHQGGERMTEVRAKAEESIRAMKVRLAGAQTALLVQTKAAAKATDVYVHENPWQAAGVAAAVGVLIGLLIARR